jgi:hypothetical protein
MATSGEAPHDMLLNFCQLYTLAMELDLAIPAADVLQRTVGQISYEITSPV